MPEDLVGVGELRRGAGAQRMHPVAVDLAQRRAIFGIRPERIGKPVYWAVIAADLCVRSGGIAGCIIADIAVVMYCCILAEIGIAVEGQRRGDVGHVRQADHFRGIVCRLRRRENGPRILVGEFQRRCAGDADTGSTSRHA